MAPDRGGMNASTAKAAVETAPAALPLIRLLMVEHYDMKQMKRRAEYEKSIAEAQAKQRQSMTTQQPKQQEPEPEPAPAPEPETGPGFSVDVTRLIEGEDCEMCRAMLEQIHTLPPEDRAVGLAEYGKMKQAVETDADVEEVRDLIEGSEVLEDAIEAST